MKYTLTKKVLLDIEMDSSEAIMLNEGGKHKINVKSNEIMNGKNNNRKHEDWEDEDSVFDVEISIKISDLNRFSFIRKEAQKHKERIENENQQT